MEDYTNRELNSETPQINEQINQAKAEVSKKVKDQASKMAKEKIKQQVAKEGVKNSFKTYSMLASNLAKYALPLVGAILGIVIIFGIMIAFINLPAFTANTFKKYINSVFSDIISKTRTDEKNFDVIENGYLTAEYLRKQGVNLYAEGYLFEKPKKIESLTESENSNSEQTNEKGVEELSKIERAKSESDLNSEDKYIESEGIYTDKNNNIRYMKFLGSPLFYYTWANGYTYFIDSESREYTNVFQKMFQAIGKIDDLLGVNGNSSDSFPGMIVPVANDKEGWKRALSKLNKSISFTNLFELLENQVFYIGKALFQLDPSITVNMDDYTMRIVPKVLLFDKEMGMTYNLKGWSGRYGLPINFISAFHKTTGAPDFLIELIKGTKKDGNKYKKTKMYMEIAPKETKTTLLYKGQLVGQSEEVNQDEELQKAIQIIADELGFETSTISEAGSDVAERTGSVRPKGNNKYYVKDVKSLETIQTSIKSVENHWFRDVYFEMKKGTEYVEYDPDYLIKTGELWAKQNNKGELVTAKAEEDWSAYKNPGGESETDTTTFKTQVVDESAFEGELQPEIVEALAKVGGHLSMEVEFANLKKQYEDARRGPTNPRIKDLLLNYKWYIYDGTEAKADKINKDRKAKKEKGIDILEDQDNPLKAKIDFTTGFMQALSIISLTRDLDAEYAFKDLKELAVELKYYTREDLRSGIRKVMMWPLKKNKMPASWPSGKEATDISKYGIKFLSKEAIKELYVQELYEEENSKIDLLRHKIELLNEKTLDSDTEKNYEKNKGELKKKQEELKKELETMEKKRIDIEKKFDELGKVELTKEEEQKGEEEKARIKERKIEEKQKNDPIFKKLYSRYGKGYDEDELIIAPVTGKLTYTENGLEIKALDNEDIKNGNLPQGYKEFYETEYKGVLAGYTIKINNVEKYEDSKEISTNKTSYKQQIPKSDINKLSNKTDREKVQRSEDLKKEAPAKYGEYVKEGTIIAKPKSKTGKNDQNSGLVDPNNIKEDKTDPSYLEKKIKTEQITMSMIDPDDAFIERIAEYIVKTSGNRFYVELQEDYDTRAGGEYDDRTDPPNVLDPEDPESVEILREMVAKHRNNSGSETLMEKNPEAFLNAQKETGVNAIFIAAVAYTETGGGTAEGSSASSSNNLFGIKNPNGNGYEKFDDPADSVLRHAKLISEGSYYYKQNKFTVNEIGPTYCTEPPSPYWENLVNDVMNSFLENAQEMGY